VIGVTLVIARAEFAAAGNEARTPTGANSKRPPSLAICGLLHCKKSVDTFVQCT
jgi:hypothetical protein